jgi:hypothetical protein
MQDIHVDVVASPVLSQEITGMMLAVVPRTHNPSLRKWVYTGQGYDKDIIDNITGDNI